MANLTYQYGQLYGNKTQLGSLGKNESTVFEVRPIGWRVEFGEQAEDIAGGKNGRRKNREENISKVLKMSLYNLALFIV